MASRKGIILAGGSGTRLYPITHAVSKQLLSIYDKPMIYYPLTVLMLAKIKDILIITTPEDLPQFKRALGDGSQWGINLSYIEQQNPDGLAQAFILAADFLNGEPSALILGDNIFFGHGLSELLNAAHEEKIGATIFGYHVNDPKRYGVIGFDPNGNVNSIIEKPNKPLSNYAITGLYFLDGTASDRAMEITPSERGELEITSLLNSYLLENQLTVKKMGRGFAWLDTGTHNSLLASSNFVKTITERQGLQIGSPDEVAYQLGLISRKDLEKIAKKYEKNEYGTYLLSLLTR